jgi:glycopeptide antibiotics resistance protein
MKSNKWKFIKVLMLLCSIGLIFYETILFRPRTEYARYALVPFWSYRLAFRGDTFFRDEILLNYLLFIPFGATSKLVFQNMKLKRCFFICLVFSSVIEVSQLVFHIGLFEWDDIIGNTLGGVIGYVLATCIYKIFK